MSVKPRASARASGALRTIDDAERRARLWTRQHLGRSAADAVAAVRGVVAQHSSDPITPYLSAWARVPALTTGTLEAAMYEARALVRMHAMRRTLFVVPADEVALFEAGAARAVAAAERKQLVKWLAAELGAGKVARWLAAVEADTLAAIGEVGEGGEEGRGEHKTQTLSERVPALATELTAGSGKWTVRVPLSSRLLFVLALEGKVVRSRPAGTWRSSQYLWMRAPSPSDTTAAPTPDEARVALVRRYLATHGPATLADVRWWTGWTAKHAGAALTGAGAVEVALADGAAAFVNGDDVAPVAMPAGKSRVALLPGLDSTPMGWTARDWYLGAHRAALFDRNGNVGPTVWLDGRIVGGWGQRADGAVVTRLLEDVGARATKAVAAEAAALEAWLGGVQAIPRFRTPLEKELAGGGE